MFDGCPVPGQALAEYDEPSKPVFCPMQPVTGTKYDAPAGKQPLSSPSVGSWSSKPPSFPVQ